MDFTDDDLTEHQTFVDAISAGDAEEAFLTGPRPL
jgi:DNA-binding FadR family transcriptional regulator